MQSTTNSKILATSKDLQRLTVVVRHGDKQQKLQVEKLTSDFRNVVEAYSTSQQVCSICAAHFLRFFLFRFVWLSRSPGALI